MKEKSRITADASSMTIMEHLLELKDKIVLSLIGLLISLIICLVYSKEITFFLQKPAIGIKFLQLAPGEYLFVSVKVSIYLAFLINTPFSIYQVMSFIIPGLTQKESKYVKYLIIGSLTLFLCGVTFGYNILIPTTLQFLIRYGSDVVEPIWSLEEYFNFVLLLLFSAGISFQIPIIQIILSIANIIKVNNMVRSWRYIIFASTILGAVITPSTDPVTQIFMSGTILLLYFSGVFALKVIQK